MPKLITTYILELDENDVRALETLLTRMTYNDYGEHGVPNKEDKERLVNICRALARED